MIEVIRAMRPVSVNLGGRDFACEERTGFVTVPQELLTGIPLSDIPEDISITPVEKMGLRIDVGHKSATFSRFSSGLTRALVHEVFRRNVWDGETGYSPHAPALLQAIAENEEATGVEFQRRDFAFSRHNDIIFLYYYMAITQDLGILEAMRFVYAAMERIHARADQLVGRRRDGLLGIFERSSFDADLNHVLTGKHPVTLVLADVDHFKQVNDTFGHLVGDEVLRAIAKVLTNRCDGRGCVEYRYGGEELAMILIGSDTARATELAESIRTDVEQLHFPSLPELKVTISLGVADAENAGWNGGYDLSDFGQVRLCQKNTYLI